MAAERYQRRAVAFLDILGFSQLVERADEPEWRIAIESVLKTLRGTLTPNAAFDLRLSQFSDCIVISAPVEPYGVQLVMTGSIILANNLLQHMVLLRGGIAIGNLIHTDDVMFGPGMLIAYRSDKSGGPPRISIDETLSGEIASWHNDFGLEALMRTDPYDLTLALHTLHDYQVYTPEPQVGKVALDETAAKISKQIAWQCYHAEHSPPVRAKWLWMERYWNEAVGAKNVLPRTTHFSSEFRADKK
ncbi:hypothetical protein [Sphingorhabdus sp.]|uniref:hypothetical protein n=1 Tax=Sphingorhabdus sp. TaxID=1902408 RepID=UPI0035B49A76